MAPVLPDKKPYTIGLIGVRDHNSVLYGNVSYVTRTLERHLLLHGLNIGGIQVVTGGGKGIEQMVVGWCENKSIPCRKIPPNIQEFGPKKAFTVRNNHVVSQSDELVMFWDGSIDLFTDAIRTATHMTKLSTIYPLV